MKIASFTVDVLVELPSGMFALYTASNGKRVWTKDLGYKPGDKVELTYDDKPRKLIINGVEKQTSL